MKGFENEPGVASGAAPTPIKILHLIIDEKFLDFTFRMFQEVESLENVESRYVALVGTPAQHLNHIAQIPLWRVAGAGYANSPQVTEDLEWCDVLVVHWWHAAAARVVEKAPNSVIVVWSGWGGDYYDLLPGGEASLYGDRTKALIRQAQNRCGTHMERVRNSMHLLKGVLASVLGKRWAVSDKKSLIKRIDFFSAPIPEDYELLKVTLGDQFPAEYVQLNYGSVEKTFVRGTCGVSGRDILLGNSATETNNHMEIIDLLSSIGIGDRKVVVPLSYGSDEYGDEIEKRGRRSLGENFVPIRNFMPLDEYNYLVSSCSIAIMNHRRQQAIGNIGTMLYHGAKLFLDENNVVYKLFKSKGAYVFSVREIAERGEEAFVSLSMSEKARNIEVIKQVWGHDIVIDNVRKFAGRMRQSIKIRA